MIIDTHVHVWADHSEEYPHQRLKAPPAYPVDTLLAHMETAGIDRAILVQPSLYGSDNSYLADCVGLYPNRLIGMGIIDVRSNDIASQFHYWVEERGLSGFRLMPMARDQDDVLLLPGTRLLWELAGKHKLPLSLFITSRHAIQIVGLVEKYPDTPLLIEHFGRPDANGLDLLSSAEPVINLSLYPSVFVKVSAISYISNEKIYPYSDTYPMFDAFWEHYGSQRLMWGSDFPGVLSRCGYLQELEIVQKQLPLLLPKDREWILHKTAELLWSFD